MAKRKRRPPRILNCLESTDQHLDWSISTAIDSNILTTGSLPTKTDLREKWWAINDQKRTGSCVGWAAADSVLRWHLVKRNMLNPKDLVSIRFVWMAAKETDIFDQRPSTFIESSGTSLKAALDIMRHYGCVLDIDLPFKSGKLYPDEENVFYAIASEFRIRNYFNLNNGDKIQNWKEWIGNGHGPILTRLNVDENFMRLDNTGSLNQYSARRYGGHAIAIVGYDEDHFIIRNSWGENWGKKGFAFASIDYAAAAFTESYGITMFQPIV